MLRNLQVQHGSSIIALWLRLYIYGLHGFFIEVLFTASWEFVVSGNWKLPGYTSIWSLPIYGIAGIVMEQIYEICKQSRLSLFLRGLCYVLWVYIWEFSTGFLLRKFNACPWDYSEFSYNVKGLITFEYAPLWFIVSILMEKVVIAHVLKLRWGSPISNIEKSHNSLNEKIKD